MVGFISNTVCHTCTLDNGDIGSKAFEQLEGLQFADDIYLLSKKTREQMQREAEKIIEVCRKKQSQEDERSE